jgi:hypothetical protein
VDGAAGKKRRLDSAVGGGSADGVGGDGAGSEQGNGPVKRKRGRPKGSTNASKKQLMAAPPIGFQAGNIAYPNIAYPVGPGIADGWGSLYPFGMLAGSGVVGRGGGGGPGGGGPLSG